MSTLAEIKAVLPNLTTRELREVESALLGLYRERKVGIIFDDAYGSFTEDDLAAVNAKFLANIEGPNRDR